MPAACIPEGGDVLSFSNLALCATSRSEIHEMMSRMREEPESTTAIATPSVLRALRYVRILNEQGVYPPLALVEAYTDAERPRVVLRDNSYEHFQREMMDEHHYAVINTVANYLVQVGWIEAAEHGVELTRLGRAVDASRDDHDLNASDSAIVNVVLKGNDPLSYVAFIEAIQRVRGDSGVMLVDPYLPSSHLPTLIANAGVNRVLTTDVDVHDANETRATRKKAFSLLLGAHAGTDLEIRYARKGAVHDRLVLPTRGAGLMVGRSLGGRQLTAVVELNDGLTAHFRQHHRAIWESAERIEGADLSHVSNGRD